MFGKKKGKSDFHVDQKVECEECGARIYMYEATNTDEGYVCDDCMEDLVSRRLER